MLLSAVANYDSQFVSASSRSTRKVHSTELEGSDFAINSPSTVTEDVHYAFDDSVTTLLANVTNRVNSNSDSHLYSKDYSSLTPEERCLWRKIQPKMKSTILKGIDSDNRPTVKFTSYN